MSPSADPITRYRPRGSIGGINRPSAGVTTGPSFPDAEPLMVAAGSLVMVMLCHSVAQILFRSYMVVCFAGARIVAAAWAADWLLLVISQD